MVLWYHLLQSLGFLFARIDVLSSNTTSNSNMTVGSVVERINCERSKGNVSQQNSSGVRSLKSVMPVRNLAIQTRAYFVSRPANMQERSNYRGLNAE
jgi:hypothetical protein